MYDNVVIVNTYVQPNYHISFNSVLFPKKDSPSNIRSILASEDKYIRASIYDFKLNGSSYNDINMSL